MSEKRYQVFISSTFTDLIEERKSIIDAIISLDCFPSGMEMFPASDLEQFEYIKSIIDVSDYYILIVAGRYGSISESGISYTEMEYDYAKEKGIPVLTFIKEDINSLTSDKIELDPDKREKLDLFRDKISKSKIVKYWNDSKDLKYNVYDSLTKAIKMHKRTGWIRGDVATDATLLTQINQLRLHNEELREKITTLQQNKYNELVNGTEKLAQGNEEYEVHYSLSYYKSDGNEYEDERSINITWNELFYGLGYKLLRIRETTYIGIENMLESVILDKVLELDREKLDIPDKYKEDAEINVENQDITTILIQLTHLKLIYETSSGNYLLTDNGKNIIVDKLLIKRNVQES